MTDNAMPAHLQAVDTESFAVKRRKYGKGYGYFLIGQNKRITNAARLRLLAAIPVPATWTKVKLCLEPMAHIQATGYDGSGKLQYLYHADYLEYRNQLKFSELHAFGQALPRIRRHIHRDLRQQGWSEEKLMALLVKILDKYHLRIGNRIYARKNQSFGLTTLRKKHLKEQEEEVYFEFVGKAAQKKTVHLTDPELLALIREIAEFPGQELFSFTKDKQHICADATALNVYIRKISQADFTARTFRTWAGTVLAVKYLNRAKRQVAQNKRRELATALTELVAEKLGNTPAICRSYYIHPGVMEQLIKEDFDPEPCDAALLANRLYRRHECRAMEMLARL